MGGNFTTCPYTQSSSWPMSKPLVLLKNIKFALQEKLMNIMKTMHKQQTIYTAFYFLPGCDKNYIECCSRMDSENKWTRGSLYVLCIIASFTATWCSNCISSSSRSTTPTGQWQPTTALQSRPPLRSPLSVLLRSNHHCWFLAG